MLQVEYLERENEQECLSPPAKQKDVANRKLRRSSFYYVPSCYDRVRSRGGWRQARPCPTLDARAPARASASLRPRPAPLAPAVSRTTPPARKDRLRDGPHLPQMAPCRNNGNMVCVRTTTDKIVRARSRPPAFRPALRRPLPKQLPVRYRHRLPVLQVDQDIPTPFPGTAGR